MKRFMAALLAVSALFGAPALASDWQVACGGERCTATQKSVHGDNDKSWLIVRVFGTEHRIDKVQFTLPPETVSRSIAVLFDDESENDRVILRTSCAPVRCALTWEPDASESSRLLSDTGSLTVKFNVGDLEDEEHDVWLVGLPDALREAKFKQLPEHFE